MKPTSELTAYLLHRRPYRETSYIVDFFCQQAGKISAVVKGVRNSKSDRKSLLQPFQPLQVSLSGRHELKNLIQLEARGKALQLQANSLYCALYINEIINRCLLAEMPCVDLFAEYHGALQALMSDQPQEPILRTFEQALLQELGEAPDLLIDCHSGEAVVSQGTYHFLPQQGISACSTKTENRLFSGQSLLDMAQRRWNRESLKAAKQINRLALAPLLGDKPLKSRELFVHY